MAPSLCLVIIAGFVANGCQHGIVENASTVQNCGATDLEYFVPSDRVGEYYYITGVRLLPLDKEQIGNITHYYRSDTLRNQVAFEVQTEYKLIDSLELRQFPDSAVVGDPLPGVVVNPIIWNDPVLRFNKAIRFRGQTILAFENILNYDDREGLDLVFPYMISPFAIHEIHLKKEYFQVENGCYELYAEWHTKDGLKISDTVTVFIDLR